LNDLSLDDGIRDFILSRSFDTLMKKTFAMEVFLDFDIWTTGFFMGVIPTLEKEFRMANKFAFRSSGNHRFVIDDIGRTVTG
jgi:hypothetical protein